MANKIKKMMNNWTAYTVGWIESSNDTYENIIHLSQEEYDELETKDPDTLYSTPDSSTDPALSIIWEIKIFSWTTIPDKFLECDWSALSTSAYPELFAVIWYTYWWSEWTFNLPNIKGKVVAWYDSGDTCFNSAWKCWWEKAHTLTVNEMPAHCHQQTWYIWSWQSFGFCPNHVSSNASTLVNAWYTCNTWWGCAHNNLQPYITLKYIIRCK